MDIYLNIQSAVWYLLRRNLLRRIFALVSS